MDLKLDNNKKIINRLALLIYVNDNNTAWAWFVPADCGPALWFSAGGVV